MRTPFIEAMAEILRAKPPQEGLDIAAGMWRSARAILRGAILTDHPNWTTGQVNAEIAKRISHGMVDHASLFLANG